MEQHYTIGFAGHVDHGKTTLVRCLTGVDTDRKPEERRRGLSIEAGVAPLRLPSGRSAAVIDVPGHVDFLKNTIRGLNAVDLGVLVVAADDGVMPQTLEHLEIMKYFKAAGGLVVLSKTDLVDEETVDIAELEVKDLLGGTFLDHDAISRFTVKRPADTGRILSRIDAALDTLPVKNTRQPFRLWIDQTRRVPGHGTVVSGTVAAGVVHTGDEVVLLPAGKKVRARSLESHGERVDRAVAGQRAGINLPGIAVGDACRGMSLAAPGALLPTFMINADLNLPPGGRFGIKNRQRVKVYIGTAVTPAMAVVMTGDRLGPGEAGIVQFRLTRPLSAMPQDAVVVSPMNVNTVIAGGRVLEVPREKYRAVKAPRLLPVLKALSGGDIDAFLDGALDAAPGRLITARELSQRTGWPRIEFERRITAGVQKGRLVYVKGGGALRQSHMADIREHCHRIVSDTLRRAPLKKHVALSEIAARMPYPVVGDLLAAAAADLCRDGRLGRFEGGFVLPHTVAQLDTGREVLRELLMAHAARSGLRPFSADTFCKQHDGAYRKEDVTRLLNFMASRKELVRLNDNRFLSPTAIDTIKARVKAAIDARGFITVGDCKALLGYGRWGGTHVLDHLNRIGFTVRRENRHTLKASPLT